MRLTCGRPDRPLRAARSRTSAPTISPRIPIKTLIERNPDVDWSELDDVILGCANQAGEDNRNLARMAGLLAGLPDSSGGVTLNRLCGSGLDAVAMAARAIRGGESELIVAGGSESMSRAPFVMPKATSAFDRNAEIYDTTIGWRFVNPKMKEAYGDDTMPSTGENVAQDFQVSRADQDAFALRSQEKAAKAQANGRLAAEIVPVKIPQRKGEPVIVDRDEHPRQTTLEALAKLKPIVRPDGSVTAGNASGVNDGAAAIIIATEEAAKRNGLTPRARVLGAAVAGVPPRIMGIGPAPASEKLMKRLGLKIADFDVIELNEAFAAQALAVLRQLGLPDDAPQVNPNGGAIALGHPLGMSGARLALTATEELQRGGGSWLSPPCASASARESRSRSNGCRIARMGGVETMAIDELAIIAVLDRVPDPEIPVLSILDLGIVRKITQDPPRVFITPTYTGCPATDRDRGGDPRRARRGRLRPRVLSSASCFRRGPPTGFRERGRERLKAYGIAPPTPSATAQCPQCGSADTEEVSRFGATPCKAQWRCKSCLEPFERFKCH